MAEQSSDWVREEIGNRIAFEHYRLKDAQYGFDSGAWEDTHEDDGMMPRRSEGNLDRDAIISHMNRYRREKDGQRIASHYAQPKYIPPWHYSDQIVQKTDVQPQCRPISNYELYKIMTGIGDKSKHDTLIEKFDPVEGRKYCMKFGCTRLQRRNRLCYKHYEVKRKNPSMSMTKHSYCHRFSLFESVGLSDEEERNMFLGPGEDSDSCASSECGDFDDEYCGEESSCGDEEELEKEQDVSSVECVIDDKCIAYSCNSPVFCKKMELCKKHYYAG